MATQREIKVPPLGESITEATIARWTKKPGEAVQADELLVELETDKITLEVTAPEAGVLSEIKNPVGSIVGVGQVIGMLEAGTQAGAQPAAPVTTSTVAPEVATTPPVAPKTPPAPLSAAALQPQLKSAILTSPTPFTTQAPMAPSVRKLVAEGGMNPQMMRGSGKDGRLTKTDILAFQEMQEVDSMDLNARVSEAREERVPMSRLRKKIAERLKMAQNTAAILTTFNEVDMTAINRIRAQYKESFEKKHGIKLGFMSFFVKAAIRALKEIPQINAEIDGDEIIYKNYYDIGVAVSAPNGLVVPVIRNADLLTFAEVEKAIAEMGMRARDGKLSIEDMTGGTFTVSNGGIFGSLMSTPIINPPQSGIMGMHKVQDRPVAIDGKVEIRPMMYIALSYDHRMVDGREAVTFLVRVKENIENPERLLLEV